MAKSGPKPRDNRDETVRSEQVKLRASPAELSRWLAKAEAKGLKLSEWLRGIANRAR